MRSPRGPHGVVPGGRSHRQREQIGKARRQEVENASVNDSSPQRASRRLLNGVAQLALLSDGDAVLRLMTLVMAPETTCRYGVSELIRIRAPSHLHGRKHVRVVDR